VDSRPADPAARRAPGLLRLALPIAISFWARDLLSGGVDLVFASQLQGEEGIGDASLAAIRLALPFNWLMIACWVGASNGLTSRLGAAMAAGESEKVEQLKAAALRIILALAALFVLLGAGIGLLAADLVPDPLTARQFRIYGMVLVAGTGLSSFWSVIPDSVVKAHRDTVTTMVAGLLSGLLNALLNWFFVFIVGWGIFGIAFSTVLSRFPPLAYSAWRAGRHERRRRAALRAPRPGRYPQPVRAILSLAVPSGTAFLVMAAEGQVLNLILGSGPAATSTLAAWGLFDYLGRFFAMPCIALSVAALPLVAHAWGRCDLAAIRRDLRTGLLAIHLYCLGFVLPLLLLAGPAVAGFFADSEATSEALGAAILLVPFASLFQAPQFFFKASFEGMQRARPGLLVTVLRMVLAAVLTALGLRLGPRLDWNPLFGAALGYCAAMALASLALGAWMQAYLRGLPASFRKT